MYRNSEFTLKYVLSHIYFQVVGWSWFLRNKPGASTDCIPMRKTDYGKHEDHTRQTVL